MLVVTTAAAGERAGCLVGFWTQASIDPARFLVCLSEKSQTFRLARRADALAVHVLPAESEGLARLFGGDTGDEIDKFSRCRWHMGSRGMPILDECHRWFVGDVIERHALGDHTGFLPAPCRRRCRHRPARRDRGQAGGRQGRQVGPGRGGQAWRAQVVAGARRHACTQRCSALSSPPSA